MKDLTLLDIIALILVIIGAINWGLVGIFDYNVVATIFEHIKVLATVVYIIVGIAGLYMIYKLLKK